MVAVSIEGYLTQQKLEQVLKTLTGENWIGNELKVPGSRRRWDMAFRSEAGEVILEYDGDEHYRNTLKMKVDAEKDTVAREHGYRVVRFPYWVQLDDVTLKHYFDLDGCVLQDFPHGFITTKLFLASFCEMGVQRFEQELHDLPKTIRLAVIDSLQARAAEHGPEFVLPGSMRALLAG